MSDFLPLIEDDRIEARAIEEYMLRAFGERCQRGSEFITAPPVGAKINVRIPIQTAHRTVGCNLDENQCLPVGEYIVGEHNHGVTSYFIVFRSIEGKVTEMICAYDAFFSLGQTFCAMDWRGCGPVVEEAEKLK